MSCLSGLLEKWPRVIRRAVGLQCVAVSAWSRMSSIDGNAHLGKTLANEATPTPQVVLWWLAVAPNEGLRLWSFFRLLGPSFSVK